jgi:hypothetical protein
MPWEGDAYEGYIPLAALRERDPDEIVVMEVQYEGTQPARQPPRRRRRRTKEREEKERTPSGRRRFTQWLSWFEHGASVGWLIRQLSRRAAGGVAGYFEGDALAERGEDDLERAIKFRIAVIGSMGEPGVWPKT